MTSINKYLGGETAYIEEWVTDNSIVLDIGAHIGSFTLWALDRGAVVYAMEPYHPSFLQLRDATATYFRCVTLNVALGPRNGKCSLRLTDDEPSSAYVIDGDEIPVLDWATLRKECPMPIDVLKVDIEGMEYEALSNTDLQNVSHFVVEIHDWVPIGSPSRPGVGHRDGPPRRKDAYEDLLTSLSTHHDITVHGDSTGGHVVGHLR